MVMPSGRRSSEPTPVPRASGTPPSSAAIVVIMIGPEAQQAGLVDGFARRLALLALGFQREVDHHDGVLLHDADEQDDADQGDDAEIGAAEQQRQQRADAGRRQRRENRDRVDVAFVQHAQHDVDRDQRGQDQQRLLRQRGLKGLGRALEAGLDAGRQVRGPAWPARWPSTASPSETPGARLKESVTTGNWPWWLTASGAVPVSMRVKALSGTCAARRPSGRRCSSGPAGRLLEVGLHFQHHVVLVQLREHGRDLPLAEGVVERVVDHLRRDAEARGGVAVDDQMRSAGPSFCWSLATSRSSGRALQLRPRTAGPTRLSSSASGSSRCTGTACG